MFDKREAFGVEDLNGVGGVTGKQKKKSKTKAKTKGGKGAGESDGGGGVAAKCCVCKDEWDRYVGKKKCYTCGVPVLMCDRCMTKKPTGLASAAPRGLRSTGMHSAHVYSTGGALHGGALYTGRFSRGHGSLLY